MICRDKYETKCSINEIQTSDATAATCMRTTITIVINMVNKLEKINVKHPWCLSSCASGYWNMFAPLWLSSSLINSELCVQPNKSACSRFGLPFSPITMAARGKRPRGIHFLLKAQTGALMKDLRCSAHRGGTKKTWLESVPAGSFWPLQGLWAAWAVHAAPCCGGITGWRTICPTGRYWCPPPPPPPPPRHSSVAHDAKKHSTLLNFHH